MPARGIVTIVVWDVIPIIEVGRCNPVAFIFVVTDGGIRDVVELAKMTVTRAVPVVEFGICPPIIHITEIDKHMWIPRLDQRWNFRSLTACAITCRADNHPAAGRDRWGVR